jgi:uncharacterized membrane protein YfcA
VPGAFVGLALLALATARMLDLFIGSVVVVATLVIAAGIHVTRTNSAKFLAGLVSGVTGLVASIGGPPIDLLYSNAEARMIRSTLNSVFTIGILLSLIFRSVSGNVAASDLAVSAVLLPAVGLGYVLSSTAKDKIDGSLARLDVLVISAVGGSALIARAIWG